MRLKTYAAAAVALALVAIPVGAAVKGMTLTELMSITTDVVHGKIIAKDSLRLDEPFEGAVYTRLTIEGESLRTGKTVRTQAFFLGTHDRSFGYTTSEMPSLQDSRLGNEIVAFIFRNPELGQRDMIFDFSGIYRIEHAFGEPVLMGKGEGGAFPENTKLSVAKQRVAKVHAELEAAQQLPGQKK